MIDHLVDWDALGILQLGYVHNGADALEMILKERPQIVISDIRMPGYDGIELTRKTIEAGIATKFILISGHRQFEYAHQAIQYGVVDYILKPIQKDALEAALRKAVAEILNQQEGKTNQQVIQQMFIKDKRQQCSAFCAQVLGYKDAQTSTSISHLNTRFELDFLLPVLMLAYELPKAEENQTPVQARLNDKIEQELHRFADLNFSEHLFFTVDNICYVLASPNQNEHKLKLDFLLERCNQIMRLFGKDKFSMGLAVGEYPNADIAILARQSKLALQQKILQERDEIILYRPDFESQANPDRFIRGEFDFRLQKLVQELDHQAISFEIGKIFMELGKCNSLNASIFIDTVIRVTELLNQAISALEEDNRIYIDKNYMLSVVGDSTGFINGQGNFEKIVSAHLQKLLVNRQHLNVRPIQIARKIISEKYAEALSLNDIAEQVHLNPVYLSVLFKKETGENFKQYVMNYRMELAKIKLRETNESIKDIAEFVGYHDLKHFRAVFRKIVGLGPMQYRKLYNRITRL